MDHTAARRDRLARLLSEEGVDAFLISNPVNVTYLTGFTGDSTYLIFSKQKTLLVSDGRFTVQIAEECPGLEAFIRPPVQLLPQAVAEVLIGVSDASRHATVTRAMAPGTEIVAPIADDWIAAGAALARLGGEAITKGRSFWNDALLAAQCARLDATLVTNKAKDFRRLRRYIGVRVVPPFPAPS